jgi:NADH-quinone oxidoreductase subunit H
MAEYIKLIAVSAIAVTFFFGGWRFPGLETLGRGVTDLAGPVTGALVMGVVSLGAFQLKVLFFLFLSVWIRASWPRMRYDRLMTFGWKWLLPLGLLNIAYTAIVFVLVPDQMLASLLLCGCGLLTLGVAASLGRTSKPAGVVTMGPGTEALKH